MSIKGDGMEPDTPIVGASDKLDKLAAEYEPTDADIQEVNEAGECVLANSEFPWELALDTYDPTFPNYTPSEDALNFFNICRIVTGSDFEVGNSMAQYFMIDVLFDNVTPDMFPYSKEVQDSISIDNDRVAICCSRGLSKSTIITNFLFIYVAITGKLPKYGRQRFWVALGASTRGHARKMALGLKASCEASLYMNEVMEYMHFTETEAHFLRKGSGTEESRYFCIQFTGIFTPIRGTKSKWNARPDMAIIDDGIPTSAAAYSKVVMETYSNALYADLGNALKANGGKIWNIFTPFNYNEPNTASILNGSFTPVLLPVARAFKDPENITKSEIESSWEEMHSKESIYKMWKLAMKSKTLGLFMQERMLRLTSGSDQLVPDDCIQYFDVKNIVKNIHAYNIYITSDFTTTSGENSDFSGVACWALSSNGDWFMLELALRKMSMQEQYTTMLDWASKYTRMGKYVELGVELDGGQATHIYSLEKLMVERAQYYTFAKQINVDRASTRKGILSRNGGGNKLERFRIAVTNYMLPKKLWLPEHLKETVDMKELIQQIKGATHKTFTRADDGPDLISMLFQLSVVIPTESGYVASTDEYKDSEYFDFSMGDEQESSGNSVVF